MTTPALSQPPPAPKPPNHPRTNTKPRTAGAFLFPNNQKMPARNMTGTAIPPTMNLKEAAETLKIHPHSMEKIIRAGHIPAGRVGRAYVLMTRDVLAL